MTRNAQMFATMEWPGGAQTPRAVATPDERCDVAKRTDIPEAAPCVVCGTTGGRVLSGAVSPHRPRGACNACYYRYRNQGRLGELTRTTVDTAAFLDRLIAGEVTPDDGGCILWPGAKTDKGYGHVTRGGRNILAAHLVLEGRGFPRPSPKHDAAHAPHEVCGNRDCVNPDHLRWATRQENMDDRVPDGTLPVGERHGRAKLTADDVRDIRRMYAAGGVTYRDLGERFGVTESMVGRIVRGQAWTHVTGGPA